MLREPASFGVSALACCGSEEDPSPAGTRTSAPASSTASGRAGSRPAESHGAGPGLSHSHSPHPSLNLSHSTHCHSPRCEDSHQVGVEGRGEENSRLKGLQRGHDIHAPASRFCWPQTLAPVLAGSDLTQDNPQQSSGPGPVLALGEVPAFNTYLQNI